MKIEDCDGCLIYKDLPDGTCRWFRKELTCPCSICLVKVMCTGSCQLMRDYIYEHIKQKVINIHKGVNYD